MSFILIPGGLWIFPPYANPNATSLSTGVAQAMTATAHKVAMAFLAPKDGTLETFEFLIGTVTQAPVNGFRVSWQDADTTPTTVSMEPDGNAAAFFRVKTTGIAANTWFQPGIISDTGADGGTKKVVTAGQVVFAVIQFESFAASDSVAIASMGADTAASASPAWNSAHAMRFTTVWNNATLRSGLCCAVKYTDGYENINPFVFPLSGFTAASFGSTTNPDERGLRFIIPFDFELAGIWTRLALSNAATSDFQVKLYSHDDTVLDSLTVDPNTMMRSATTENIYIPMDRFSPCQGGAVHRITLLPTSTNTIELQRFNVPSNAHLNSVGGGIEHYWTERNDAGSWSDLTTARPWLGLQLSRINAVASGAGGKFVGLG